MLLPLFGVVLMMLFLAVSVHIHREPADSMLTCICVRALTNACAPAVCPYGQPTTATVSQPFVMEPVPVSDCLWVNVEIVADATVYAAVVATNQAVEIGITSQTLTFDGGAGPVDITIPAGVVTFSPDSATVPTTSLVGGVWETTVAASSTATEVRQ